MPKEPYLTKSTFLGANKCEKRLWNNFHNAPPREGSVAGSIQDIGDRIGRFAHGLFPGGVEVTEAVWEHEEALTHTAELMADESVPAIFEAALEFGNVRVRIDALERLEGGRWGIREVKSATSARAGKKNKLRTKYARDTAIQLWVAKGCGLDIASVELVHPNKEYVRLGPGFSPGDLFAGIDPQDFFNRDEVLPDILEQAEDARPEIAGYLKILAGDDPKAEPSKNRCNESWGGFCPLWEICTADKPEDWVDILYSARAKQLKGLKDENKHRISQLTAEDTKIPAAKRMIRAVAANGDIFEESLAADLGKIKPPAIHLDFEYLAGFVLPLYAGLRPSEKVAFQFSAHRLNEDGSIEHIGAFLADGEQDPRREFADKLIELLDGGTEPIVVYAAKNAELPVIEGLIDLYPDLADPLGRIIDRIVDLLAIVQDNVMVRRMIGKHSIAGGGFFSLKKVAPALIDGFGYGDLGVVSHGGAAVEAFFQMVTGEMPQTVESGKNGAERSVTRDELRASMLAYCAKDTEATAQVHLKLIEISQTTN